MTLNDILNNWIKYSSSRRDIESKKAFIYIQDLVVYNIDSGHSDICIAMLNRLDQNNKDVKEIKEIYNAKMGIMGTSTDCS